MLDLPDWKSLSKEQRLDLLEPHRLKGESATTMAKLFTNCTRNSVIGLLTRAKVPLMGGDSNRPRPPRPHRAKTTPHGNKGRPKADAVLARIRRRAEDARTKLAALPLTPLPEESEEGVDVTHLIGLVDLTERTCKFPHGDPLKPGFGFCGAPSEPGSPYCDHHRQRAYVRRSDNA